MKLHPALRWLLWPLSLITHAAARLRAWCYGRGLLRQRGLNGMVASVGNLTVGGTGKTPMVIWLAERLHAEGRRVGILTRGYRGIGEPEKRGVLSSDEVALMRDRLDGKAQFGIGRDRYAKGRVLERHGVDDFVLDDGFQHLQLARDVDIVLIDATDPFGGGHLLPAGRLREPRSALRRAGVVVITRAIRAPAVEAMVRHHTQAPIFYAQTRLEGFFSLGGNPGSRQPAQWEDRKLFAFCGIGNPDAFYEDLRRWGVQLAGTVTFRDHYHYSQQDLDKLERRARVAGAEALVCTEKDVYNLRGTSCALPIAYCAISLDIAAPEDFLAEVRGAAAKARRAAR